MGADGWCWESPPSFPYGRHQYLPGSQSLDTILMSCGSALGGLALIGLCTGGYPLANFYTCSVWYAGTQWHSLYPVTFTVVTNWFVANVGQLPLPSWPYGEDSHCCVYSSRQAEHSRVCARPDGIYTALSYIRAG